MLEEFLLKISLLEATGKHNFSICIEIVKKGKNWNK